MAARQVTFEINLPDELFPADADERAKVGFVMDLLRRRAISQGKAAELLGVSRWDLVDVMKEYGVIAINYDPKELVGEKDALRKALGDPSDG